LSNTEKVLDKVWTQNQVENLFLVLVSDIAGKPQIAVMIAENLVQDKGLHAGNIIKDLPKKLKAEADKHFLLPQAEML
jgi:hypothetical protein